MAEKIVNPNEYLVYEQQKLTFLDIAYLCGGYHPPQGAAEKWTLYYRTLYLLETCQETGATPKESTKGEEMPPVVNSWWNLLVEKYKGTLKKNKMFVTESYTANHFNSMMFICSDRQTIEELLRVFRFIQNLPPNPLFNPKLRGIQGGGQIKGPEVLPLVDGLQWKDVAITVHTNGVRVKTKNISKKMSLADLGFEDKKKVDRGNLQWEMLRGLAEAGRLDASQISFKEKGKIKQRLSKIRKILKGLMQINDDPLPYNYSQGIWEPRLNLNYSNDPI